MDFEVRDPMKSYTKNTVNVVWKELYHLTEHQQPPND